MMEIALAGFVAGLMTMTIVSLYKWTLKYFKGEF
jgi:hypothetical protein